jgi:polyhydroxyalkanoate synthesis regulator protein
MNLVKYRNRRLYCSELRNYVDAGRVLGAVRAGQGVRIICHATRRDITAEVLLGLASLAAKGTGFAPPLGAVVAMIVSTTLEAA